jgi:mannose-1-phosphate guanylyltransferase
MIQKWKQPPEKTKAFSEKGGCFWQAALFFFHLQNFAPHLKETSTNPMEVSRFQIRTKKINKTNAPGFISYRRPGLI